MIKSILKWTLGIIGVVAIGLGVVHAIKMGTDENYRTHINAAWGIEQTIEEEEIPTVEDDTADETTNGDTAIDGFIPEDDIPVTEE